jgi:DedD protein
MSSVVYWRGLIEICAMAKDDDRPQFNPKHRIAGAIILVSLAVIFVPMLLDETEPPPENQSLTEIPVRDEPETKVVISPVTPGDAPVAEPTASPQPLPALTEQAVVDTTPKMVTVKPDEPKPAVTKAADKSDSPSAKPKTVVAKSGEPAPRVSHGWVVQVGTFANADNAARLRDQLKQKGFTVDSEATLIDGKKAMRLSVGPYRDKPAATKAQAQLKKDLNINGMVLAYP